MEYYTYAYLREDGTPYYVGKGKNGRILEKERHNVKVPPKNRIIYLKKNITEEEAFRHEKYMIAVFGRKDLGTGILRNMTDGGEGCSGYKHSEEAKMKISKANSGRKWSDDAKKNLSKKCLGRKPKPMSQENKEKLSKMRKGVSRPQYVIDKMMMTRKNNESFIGYNNPNSKKFLFISPEGNEYLIEGGFKKFCLENNLSYYGLQNFKKTGKILPCCKGWKVFTND
jgi:hypothetical protein